MVWCAPPMWQSSYGSPVWGTPQSSMSSWMEGEGWVLNHLGLEETHVTPVDPIFFLGPQHMEVPRLGVESELWLPAYTTATAVPDLSHICDLYHSSWQHWILNLLRETRDGTSILMDTSRVCYRWDTMGTADPIPLIRIVTWLHLGIMLYVASVWMSPAWGLLSTMMGEEHILTNYLLSLLHFMTKLSCSCSVSCRCSMNKINSNFMELLF